MTRLLMIVLTASAVALWAVTSKADEWSAPVHTATMAPLTVQGSFYHPGHAWPRVAHDPAITKTLRSVPAPGQATTAPPYDPQWQRQPAPPATSLAPPRFSHPQQGYYPREGTVPQVPGYEYDFGGAGTFPPVYPMEGANWKAPRSYLSSKRAPAHPSIFAGTYADCPR